MTEKLWYMEDDEVAAAARMVSVARAEWAAQGQQRMRLAEDSLALYMGSTRHTLTGTTNPLSMLGLVEESSSYNVVQAIVDTKLNHTLRNRVRPMFVTEGGDSELREKAEAMQEAADGIAYDLGLDGELGRQAGINGYLFEGGGVEWWADTANSRVDATPVWPWQYFVVRQEARHGRPRQMFGRYVMPRDVLLSFVGEDKAAREAVEDAPSAGYEDVRNTAAEEPGKVADMVVVYKAWHLPSGRVDLKDPRAFGKTEKGNSGKASHDGRHMVALDNKSDAGAGPLIDIPWPHDYYPVSWFKPNPIPGSFWSRGEPEVLANAQIELMRWNSRMEKILDLHARPMILLSKGAKLNPAMINNALANIFQVEGNTAGAITQLNQSAVPQDLLRRVQDIAGWARDQRGMSEMSMTARKPTGVNHEPGLAYLADTETVRHTVEFKAWERFNIDSYKNIIRCLRELAERDKNFEVVFATDEALKRRKWADIDVDAEKYRLKAWGTNLLKQGPAQRADQIMDFVDRGYLEKEAAFDAIDAPDMKALMGDRNVMKKNVEKRLKSVVRGPYDERLMPTPYIDLNMAKRLGMQTLNKLELNDEADEKQERVVKFLQDVDIQLAKLAPPPRPPGPGGPPLPPGVTQAPPPIT
jgi:hypothetical protein